MTGLINAAVDRMIDAANAEGKNGAQALMFAAAMASITASEDDAVSIFREARQQLIERGARLRVVEAQKDEPPSRDDQKDDLRKEYREDPDAFKEKWGEPPAPGETPPSGPPQH